MTYRLRCAHCVETLPFWGTIPFPILEPLYSPVDPPRDQEDRVPQKLVARGRLIAQSPPLILFCVWCFVCLRGGSYCVVLADVEPTVQNRLV